MFEFSPISSDKKIHDLTAPLNDNLPTPSLTLPKHKGPNSPVRVDAIKVAKALDKNGVLAETTPEAEKKVLEAMCYSFSAAIKNQFGG